MADINNIPIPPLKLPSDYLIRLEKRSIKFTDPYWNKMADKYSKPKDPAVEAIRAVADRGRDENHASNELIERVDLPDWAAIAISTARPELMGIGAPATLDETDTILVLNAMRVLLETNINLRKRVANAQRRGDKWCLRHHNLRQDINKVVAQDSGRTLGVKDAMEINNAKLRMVGEDPDNESED